MTIKDMPKTTEGMIRLSHDLTYLIHETVDKKDNGWYKSIPFGFVAIDANYIGALSSNTHSICGVILRYVPFKVEDEKEDPKEFPYLVFIRGIDDVSYGKRFRSEEESSIFAKKITKDGIVSINNDELFWIN